MNYLIKLIIIFLVSFNLSANEKSSEKIIFKINNKAFTTAELNNINKYYKLIYNDINYVNENQIENFISLIIFNEYFINNKRKINEDINEVYENLLKKYENQNNELSKIHKYLGKEKIIKYLSYDLNKKNIIEKLINTKENLSVNNIDEKDLIYNTYLKYFIINKHDFDNIKKEIEKDDIDDLKLKALLTKYKINYLYKEDILNNKENLDKKIKTLLESNQSNFISYNENYITYGFIRKRLKSYDGIEVKLFNIETIKEITKDLLECNNIENLSKQTNINVKSGIYKYNSLKDIIKNNLYFINDFIQLESNDKFNYILLCEISFDKNLFNEITISQKVNELVNEIENEFINEYKKKYNLIINE